MLFCKGCQIGVRRITFMGDVRRKDTAMGTQHAFCTHPVCVLNHLMSAEVVTAGLFGTVGMIQDYDIKSHLALAKSLPSFVEQRRCIRSVEDSAPFALNRIQHCPRPQGMI